MSRGFVFFLIAALLTGVALWGYIGQSGQRAVKDILIFKRFEEVRVRLADVTLGGVTIRAEVAETAEARAQGLSNRASLPEQAGMLFLFDRPGIYGFWMKDMKFSIDIIWINDRTIVDISPNVLPVPDGTPPTYRPRGPANRALEVKAGFAKAHGLSEGSPVLIRFDGFR